MKNEHLIILLALTWFVACTPRKEEIVVNTENTEEVEKSINEFSFTPETLKSIKSDPFLMSSAAIFSSNFLDRSNDFNELDAKNNFSGTFDAKYFKKDSTKKGVRFWYCYNKSGGGGYPKFFLAVEQVDYYIEDNPEYFSDFSKKLTVPIISGYTGSFPNGKESLEEYYRNHNEPDPIVNKEIEFGKVLDFAFQFKNLMIDLDSIFGHLPSKYAVAYFDFNDAYDSLLDLNPIKIKYTMAYIPIKGDKPNYLRPVLMGIDNSGKIIIERNGYSKGTFLQKSFPPPPYQ